MTTLLEKAFKKAAALPETDQNIVAHWLIDEISSKEKWNNTFAASEDVLSKLADDALAEHKAGKTRVLDVNEL